MNSGGVITPTSIWSQMARDPAKRTIFIQSMVDIADEYGFEGFDIDWEFPAIGNGADEDIDKEDLAVLLEECKAAFDPLGLRLSVVLAASKKKQSTPNQTIP